MDPVISHTCTPCSRGYRGLDASIGFESTRAENAGVFINATLAFFGPTVSAYLSLADNIAMVKISASNRRIFR